MNRTTEKIPTWSLCYLINGDATALTDEEIRMVDEWVSQWQVEIVSPLMDEDGNIAPIGSGWSINELKSDCSEYGTGVGCSHYYRIGGEINE